MSRRQQPVSEEAGSQTLLWRQLRAAIMLPGVVLVLAPTILLTWKGVEADFAAGPLLGRLVPVVGLILAGAGLGLVGWTVALFQGVGGGTLAPWDPPARLVLRGPYLHLRNPMILGVAVTLSGEALLFRSWPLLMWAACFVGLNLIFIPLVEEPGLERRFGESYRCYRRAVPRWIPRLAPLSDEERKSIAAE